MSFIGLHKSAYAILDKMIFLQASVQQVPTNFDNSNRDMMTKQIDEGSFSYNRFNRTDQLGSMLGEWYVVGYIKENK